MVLESPYEFLFDGNLKSLHYFVVFVGDDIDNDIRLPLEGNPHMVHCDARYDPLSYKRAADDIP